MRSRLLMAAAAMTLASVSMPTMPVALPGESRPDPYKPKTRRRPGDASPAQRLMERQRQKNQTRRKAA